MVRLSRFAIPLLSLFALVACGGPAEPPEAPDAEVAAPEPAEDAAAAEPAADPPAPSAETAAEPEAAPAPASDPAPDPTAPREVKYIQSSEGLKVEVSGVRFLVTASPVKRPNGFAVRVDVKAESLDEKTHHLLSTDTGPLAIAGAVTRKGKTTSFGDERRGEADQSIDPGSPLEFSREWPEKGTGKPLPLGNGDSVELDVGLWGVGDDANSRRPLRQFARVKARVQAWKPKATVEPPPNIGKGK